MNNIQIIFGIAISLLTFNCLAQKNLNIQDSPNFRSLSGLTNKENKKIKEDIVYRSGSFSNLSGNDAEIFKSLGINTIVDFRTDFEIKKDPDFIPEGKDITIKRAKIGALDSLSMTKMMAALTNPKLGSKQIDSLMIDANIKMAQNIVDFKPFFDEVKNEDAIVLFHCSAGKDRTGIASSLLLYILDFSYDEIMKDYLRSNEAVSKINTEKYKQYGIPEDKIKSLMGVKQEYLEAAWNTFKTKYGSVDNMLLKEFNIDKNTKKKIQNKYLSR